MNRSIRDALLVCIAPFVVLLIGIAMVSSSQTTTDASGHSTSTTDLTDAPALGVYAATLAALAVSVLVMRRVRRARGQ